tara:strand:- start:3015 stop:4118 length:1104 start_codon:yes stop_codon:yes gene_type:complete
MSTLKKKKKEINKQVRLLNKAQFEFKWAKKKRTQSDGIFGSNSDDVSNEEKKRKKLEKIVAEHQNNHFIDTGKEEAYISKMSENTTKYNQKMAQLFDYLFEYTNVTDSDMEEIMNGAYVHIGEDGGKFYNLMCGEILMCRKQHQQHEIDGCKVDGQSVAPYKCATGACKDIYTKYYTECAYMDGSSHESWNETKYPQFRLGKQTLPNYNGSMSYVNKMYVPFRVSKTYGPLCTKNCNKSENSIFDFIIGLKKSGDKISTWFQLEAARGEEANSLSELYAKKNKIWQMATAGHLKSSMYYGLSKENQGPFGTSKHNDDHPLKLEYLKHPSDTYDQNRTYTSENFQHLSDTYNQNKTYTSENFQLALKF